MATETLPPSTKGSPEHARRPRLGLTDVLERGGLPILLVLLMLWFAIDPTSKDAFVSEANFKQLLGNQSVTGIIALAMIVPLVAGYFDLSVAAVAGMANITAASVIGTHGHPVWVGIVAALLVAGLAGCVNGFLVAGLKLNGFIVTLGTYTFIGGLLSWYTKGQTISSGIPESLTSWGSGDYLGVPRPFWLLIAIALVVWYVLMHIPFGRQLESIGSNERAARLVGIRVDRVVFLSFLASSLLAGVAGVLLTSRSGSADPTAGPAYLFPALAAVFLGATAIRPGRYNVWGTIIGVFLVAVAVNGFTLLGADSWVTPVFNGAALVGAVTVSTLIGRSREKRGTKLAQQDGSGAAPADLPAGSEPAGAHDPQSID
jgi:ribose transport system permease protein